MSRRRIKRPFETKLTVRMSCSESNAPETRSKSFSTPVCIVPDGLTRFCARRAEIKTDWSIPSPASHCVENSTKITSS